MKEKLFNWAYKLLRDLDFSKITASYINLLVNILILAIIAFILDFVFRKILTAILTRIAKRTKTEFDDFLLANNTVTYIAHLIPLLFIVETLPIALEGFIHWENFFEKSISIVIILLSLWIARSILNAMKDYLKKLPAFSDKPIDSYIQVIMIFLWVFAVTVLVSLLLNKPVMYLVGTFGAVSAIVILIFKDTILGFVASIQVSVNDMVRIGDWITIDKFGADGDVIEINLATVKVRNFDNTTTTIPTYNLISDSFKNWRGMTNSGGRRIKRSILIKATTIRFINNEELEEYKKIQLLTSYIIHRQNDIEKFNQNSGADKSLFVNGRNLTNLGIFRKYINQYIAVHPGINKEMTMMCRHLQPTAQGIPIEIYAFSNDKRWINYEYIMADIFDHIIAAVPYFGLEIYELSSDSGTSGVV